MYFLVRSGYSLLVAVLVFLTAATAQAMPSASEVFSLDASRNGAGTVELHFAVSPGNYLYRDRITATVDGRELPLTLPAGEKKDDPNFGLVQVFHQGFGAALPASAQTGTLSVKFQGCADAGICYPPVTRTVDLGTLAVASGTMNTGTRDTAAKDASSKPAAFAELDFTPKSSPVAASAPVSTPSDGAQAALSTGPAAMLLAFLGFGLLLSFTPCVFPMIPILSAMLTRSGEHLSATRGFVLSSVYVLAMAAAYGLVGLVAGWSGANLQAALQTPWALGLSAAVFVALAMSMFGLYDLQLPAGLANRLSRGSGGSLAGAAMLGFGSALIVGPCVTPPLAAAMLYAVQTGDVARGAGALFALGLGMGLPLIAVGTFGARILPKSGRWLAVVRPVFGAVFLAVAVMLAARLLPGPAALALWGVFAIGVAVFIGAFDRLDAESGGFRRLSKTAGLVAALYGAVMVVGAAGGVSDPLRPLVFTAPGPLSAENANDARVTSLAAMNAAIKGGTTSGAPVLVSFSADWCTTCKSNEKIMEEPQIDARLKKLPMITADVTAQGSEQRALMSRYAVVGPPVLFLLDAEGREIQGSRIVGPVTADEIARRLDMAGV